MLPALTLGTIPLAIVAKITRGSMLEVLSSRLRADGSREGSRRDAGWWCTHALRNALVPIITVLGLQTGLLLGGAVLTESVFAWPGVGRLAFDAISNRDMPVINGCVLLFAAVFVVVNTAVDVLYALANPEYATPVDRYSNQIASETLTVSRQTTASWTGELPCRNEPSGLSPNCVSECPCESDSRKPALRHCRR